jgi:hypothetical protein
LAIRAAIDALTWSDYVQAGLGAKIPVETTQPVNKPRRMKLRRVILSSRILEILLFGDFALSSNTAADVRPPPGQRAKREPRLGTDRNDLVGLRGLGLKKYGVVTERP